MELLRESQEYMDELREKVDILSARVNELLEQETKAINFSARKQAAGRTRRGKKTASARKK